MCAIMMNKEYTPQEVAKILRVDYATVIRRLKAGVIRGRKEGQQWRVSEDDLQKYIDSTYRNGPQRST